MATLPPYLLTGPAGVRLYGGRFGPGRISGAAQVEESAAGGGLASLADLSGNAQTDEPAAAGGFGSAGASQVSGNAQIDEPSAGGGLQGVVESGAQITTLNVRETLGAAGTVPYSATVLPLRGQLPSGQTLVSEDDATMRATILATHDDGSAALVVVAGQTAVTANQTKSLRVQSSASSTGSALTTAAIAAVVSSVAVNFQGSYGSATLSSFGSPERVWWANPAVICARYRLAAPTPGSTALEAVIDIHAYAGGRALVEVVIENGKMDSSSPTKPAAATYTGATVAVNGSTVATVNSTGPASAEGNHAAFRAWYARAWVGGDPGLRVTQNVADLQRHPLLWAIDRPSTADLSGYAADAYSAWTTGRQRATAMGGTGDHPSIGPLPQWEAQALQSGDHRAWNATEVSALAALSYNISYRDSATGLVPTFSAIGTRSQASGTWPNQTNGSDAAMWETAHAPDVGLMAFIGRPSPVFIEIAQKAALWNGTWSSDNTPGWSPGLFGYWFQIRGRAWGIRSVAHATFITPSSLPWRAAGVAALAENVTHLSAWTSNANHTLNTITDYTPSAPRDFGGTAGFQNSIWQHHYLTSVLHRMASTGLLSGASQTAANALADWMATQPVRWVNEQPLGGWRYVAYETTMGDNATTINSAANWQAEMTRAGNHGGNPPSVSGSWMGNGGVGTSYASGYSAHLSANAYYPTYLYDALVTANERGIVGAPKAWYTVEQNITNLATWKQGFGTDPRWGSRPRSVTGSGLDTTVWDGGQGAAYKGNQTFNTLQGVFDAISSAGGWAQLPNTNMQTVVPSNAAIDAISPNPVLRQGEQDLFIRIWGSACWNGFGWFFVVPGGHFAGYRNDTYNIRLADPVGVVRMHMPAPIVAVYGRNDSNPHPTNPDTLIAQNLWASQSESNIASIPAWGPRGCHQYASMVWDAATEKMVMAGDSQQYALNLTDIGQSPQAFSVVYIFDPYAPTPRQAWTRLRTGTTGANIEGGMNNGDGTVSYRVHNTAELFTVNLATRQVTPGAVLASPSATQYQSWRHCARDPATGATYELAGQTWNADVTNFALWRTSGGLQKIANLPSSCWTGSPYQDEQSAIVIHNGRAYVCFQTGPGTSTGDGDTNATVQLGVHQINLSTGAVQSFTTSPNMPTPDTLYAGTSLNGLNGRFSFVPQVGAFVVMLSARANVWVFRPPASWAV